MRRYAPVTLDSTYTYQGWEYRIDTWNGEFPCRIDILKSIGGVMHDCLTHYSKVLFIRLDFKVFEYSKDNSQMVKFIKNLKKKLLRSYGIKNVGYIWCREQERAKKQHYHLCLFLNGHKIRVPFKLIRWIEEYHERRDLPKPYTPKNCYTMITRRDATSRDLAFFRASYLAKPRGKGYAGQSYRNYSSSQFKPESQD